MTVTSAPWALSTGSWGRKSNSYNPTFSTKKLFPSDDKSSGVFETGFLRWFCRYLSLLLRRDIETCDLSPLGIPSVTVMIKFSDTTIAFLSTDTPISRRATHCRFPQNISRTSSHFSMPGSRITKCFHWKMLCSVDEWKMEFWCDFDFPLPKTISIAIVRQQTTSWWSKTSSLPIWHLCSKGRIWPFRLWHIIGKSFLCVCGVCVLYEEQESGKPCTLISLPAPRTLAFKQRFDQSFSFPLTTSRGSAPVVRWLLQRWAHIFFLKEKARPGRGGPLRNQDINIKRWKAPRLW